MNEVLLTTHDVLAALYYVCIFVIVIIGGSLAGWLSACFMLSVRRAWTGNTGLYKIPAVAWAASTRGFLFWALILVPLDFNWSGMIYKWLY